MNSFELDIGEQSRIGVEFMARVANELRRALATEKATRKLTQQAIAKKIGTSRSVVNREFQGLENLSARRIAELCWAIGWEPHFEVCKIPATANYSTALPKGVFAVSSETTAKTAQLRNFASDAS